MLTTDALRALIADHESDRVELTVSTTNTDKFGEAICAFANDFPNHRQHELAADCPTHAGALLFAREPLRWVPGAWIQFVRWAVDDDGRRAGRCAPPQRRPHHRAAGVAGVWWRFRRRRIRSPTRFSANGR